MSFSGFNKYGLAFDEGKVHYQYVTKTATPATGTAGFFADMNQTSGQPKYNAFTGTQFAFTPLTGEGNGGVYPGNFVTGSTKHLIRWQVLNANSAANTIPPDHIILCDYLGFYSFIDGDDTDTQPMDNTLSLTRYTDGVGVRVVVITQAPMASIALVTMSYTNQAGTAGRSVTFTVSIGPAIGVAVVTQGTIGGAGQANPFVPLAAGDTGVRSIESVTFASASGGFMCFALVKPLASMMCYEGSVTTEKVYGIDIQNPPEIKEGAYLNFLIQRSGTLAGSLRSELIFINS